jgi:hypothetical protein
MMTWFDMYNESIKNFEKIAQLQKDYIHGIETVNHLYDDFTRNYEKINKAYEQQNQQRHSIIM